MGPDGYGQKPIQKTPLCRAQVPGALVVGEAVPCMPMVPAQAIDGSGMFPMGNAGVDWVLGWGLAWGKMAQEGQGLSSRLLLELYSLLCMGPQIQPVPAKC